LGFLCLASKVWIALPKLGGADKLDHMICDGEISQYVKASVGLIQTKIKEKIN
jgi:hypothetical protein